MPRLFYCAGDEAAGRAGLATPRESAQGSLSSGMWRPLLLAAPSLRAAEAAGQAAPPPGAEALATGLAASAAEAAGAAWAAKAGTDTEKASASRQ